MQQLLLDHHKDHKCWYLSYCITIRPFLLGRVPCIYTHVQHVKATQSTVQSVASGIIQITMHRCAGLACMHSCCLKLKLCLELVYNERVLCGSALLLCRPGAEDAVGAGMPAAASVSLSADHDHQAIDCQKGGHGLAESCIVHANIRFGCN